MTKKTRKKAPRISKPSETRNSPPKKGNSQKAKRAMRMKRRTKKSTMMKRRTKKRRAKRRILKSRRWRAGPTRSTRRWWNSKKPREKPPSKTTRPRSGTPPTPGSRGYGEGTPPTPPRTRKSPGVACSSTKYCRDRWRVGPEMGSRPVYAADATNGQAPEVCKIGTWKVQKARLVEGKLCKTVEPQMIV